MERYSDRYRMYKYKITIEVTQKELESAIYLHCKLENSKDDIYELVHKIIEEAKKQGFKKL